MRQLSERILMTTYFQPVSSGAFGRDHVAHYLVDVDEDEVQSSLDELSSLGFAAPHSSKGYHGPQLYVGTKSGWRQREALLRQHGRRHKAMVRSGPSVEDIILAILNRPQPPAGYMASDNWFPSEALEVYLHTDAAPVVAASDRLVELELADYVTRDVRNVEYNGIKPTLKGARLYKARVRRELEIDEGSWILDEIKRTRVSLFFAWQSDFGPSRNQISDALKRLESEAAQWLMPSPLVIELAVEPEDGAVRIDSSLQDKIARTDLFVADVTPVYRYSGKLCPNPNVLVEIGFALAALAPPQIILIERARDDVPGDGVPGTLPFDIRQVHRIRYDQPKELRRALISHVKGRLQALGLLSRPE